MECVILKILAVSEVEGFYGVCGIGFSDDVEFYKGKTRIFGHLKGEGPANPFPPHVSDTLDVQILVNVVLKLSVWTLVMLFGF